MAKMNKAFAAHIELVGERQVRVIANTGGVDRTGEQVVLSGLDLSGFLQNPIILYQHDPDRPVGRASQIQMTPAGLEMLVDFAPVLISPTADEVCGLVKAKILNAVSIGFDPIETEPMTPGDKRKNAPQRYLKADLMETSFVSIPADKGALVTQRQYHTKAAQTENWVCAAAKDLEIDQESTWNGREAAERILDAAGFNEDRPDPDKAKKGFLVYDAGNPTLKGSYKLPFGDIQKGQLVAIASGIRAADSRIAQTDIPDDIKEDAEKIIALYKAHMNDTEQASDKSKDGDKKNGPRGVVKSAGRLVVKDLYTVANLAYLLDSLGYLQAGVRIETALEGDSSAMPARLAQVIQDLGAALVAMTAEEVAEAVTEAAGSLGQEENFENMATDDAGIVQAGKTPAIRRFRAAMVCVKNADRRNKSGKRISAATSDKLHEALAHHEKAMEAHRDALKEHTKCAAVIKGVMGDDEPDPAADPTMDDPAQEGDGAVKSMNYRMMKAASLRAKAI